MRTIFLLALFYVCDLASGCTSDSARSFSLSVDPSVEKQALAQVDTTQRQQVGVEAQYGKFNDSLRLTVDPHSGALHPVFFWLNFDRSNDKAFLYCCGHSDARFKLQQQDTPQQCIEVPFRKAELVLSTLPAANSRIPIYGHLAFKSVDYYLLDGDEDKKTATDIDTYFIARYHE